MSFSMPSSWYDPPEYQFQKQAEEIYDKNLWGLYETNPETGKIVKDYEIPYFIGTEQEVMEEYRLITEVHGEKEDGDFWTPMELTFETCCEMAESQYDYDDYLADKADYEYHLEKESPLSDYE